jgi:hypothetical protein
MSPLNVGGNLNPTGSVAQRLAAIEDAVTRMDAALRVVVQGMIDEGIRTDAALQAAAALGLPPPPPLPSTVSE